MVIIESSADSKMAAFRASLALRVACASLLEQTTAAKANPVKAAVPIKACTSIRDRLASVIMKGPKPCKAPQRAKLEINTAQIVAPRCSKRNAAHSNGSKAG